jgi:hypothetical protein
MLCHFAVAGRTISAPILNAIASIADSEDTTKLVFQGISYKPFLSLFKMTGVTELNPQLAGIGTSQPRRHIPGRVLLTD